ncbi:MAG: sigma-70 family RNA polymerase sigma factor [Planctomycetota bacterium]|nr:MAG: sigma-70 family RNA polymerase sigma factor [Planctomycetota bacterium]
MSTDSELIERSLQGDKSAFAELVERYREKSYWIAYNMLHNYEDARDISQEAFIRIYRSLDKFNPKRQFYTWLYQIVVNLCIDHLRKWGKRKSVSLEENLSEDPHFSSSPYHTLEEYELCEEVHQILKKIPPKYRSVLILRDLEGLSCQETAEIIGCTYATARWRLHQARQMFRELWEKKHTQSSSNSS